MRSRVTAVLGVAALTLLTAPTATAGPSHSVPPAAPSPTDSGNSPAAPDPHPPRGGLDSTGDAVGGSRLLGRQFVLPVGASRLPRDVTAQAWMVTDLDTGRVVAARDPHGRYQPASIQKVLTAATLIPRLPGSRVVTVSRRAATTEGSHAGLLGGGRYTVDDLFEGLLLVSGNDCAEALAEAAGGRAKTVALMNRTALALGAVDTLIETPSGLDGWKQLTSAYDMTLFLRAALAQPRFARYDRVARSVLPFQKIVGRVAMYNQNQDFLTRVRGALVAKTGFTDAAEHTFAGAIERGGHRYGVVLMRAQRYPVDQWVQATRLVNWALRQPTDARVGTLVTPTRPESPTANPATTRSDAADAAPSSSPDDGGFPVWTQFGLAAVLLAGLAVLGWRVGRRH